MFASLLLLASVVLLAGWWMMRQSLPQVSGEISVRGLKGAVTVDRDAHGVPHIRAESMEDLLVAQGYVLAQDRLFQMDLIRRSAAGELSEVLGEPTVALDKESRILGLRQVAEAAVAALPSEQRILLEAYARGVNAYIEQHRNNLPWEMRVLGYSPQPWTGSDSLLLHAYMSRILSDTWEWELNRARVTEAVGPERARDLFVVDSELDRVVVGEAAQSAPPAKAAPAATKRVSAARPADVLRAAAYAQPAQAEQALALASAARALSAARDDFELRAGSNNWVVSGAHTASGKPLLANDTHLPNDVPSIWYLAHLQAPGYNVKGFCLPGGPLVVIGHNERIAWGFTNNGADVQDLYLETFNPENPKQYRVNGKWVEATQRHEMIKVKGSADAHVDVVTTRHGPIVHRDGKGAYALRWVALEAGGLGWSHSELGKANNWQEFLAANKLITGPAQNTVYADVEGNIGFVVGARVPVRKKGDGSVPVPGDTDDYEWTGYVPFEEMPQVLNPASGRIATANARVAGSAYKPFLTDRWYEPERTKRIYDLLEGHKEKFTPRDFIRIQTDVYSGPHVFIAEQLQAALKVVEPQDARVRMLAHDLPIWDGRALRGNRQMPMLEYMRRELLRQVLAPYLKDQTARYQWSRSFTFLTNVLRQRPASWLPAEHKSYDHLIVASADAAVRQIERDLTARGEPDAAQAASWDWGTFVQLQMLHPFGRTGFLRRHLSVAGVKQNGSGYSVKQTGRSFGPAMRFVADLSNFDNSLMNITLGQSGHYLSRHYRDQFDAWYEGGGIPSQFSEAAEASARKHRLTLKPAS